jgi:hypothetical protein
VLDPYAPVEVLAREPSTERVLTVRLADGRFGEYVRDEFDCLRCALALLAGCRYVLVPEIPPPSAGTPTWNGDWCREGTREGRIGTAWAGTRGTLFSRSSGNGSAPGTPLQEIGVGNGLAMLLRESDYVTVAELTELTEGEVSLLDGIGPKRLAILKRALSGRGFAFKSPGMVESGLRQIR